MLASRLRVQDLHGGTATLRELKTLSCGFRDAGEGTGDASLALRLGSGAQATAAREAGRLVTAMTLRGSPHVIRASDLTRFRSALVPVGRDDLEATTGPLPDAVAERDDPVAEVARALDERFTDGMTKAELSRAATALLPKALTPFCDRCSVAHPIDGLFRMATLRAWLVLVPGTKTQTFTRHGGQSGAGTPTGSARARSTLARRAREACVPADEDQLATWLGWAPKSVPRTPAADAPAATPPDKPARLLPAHDPWLRGSDRGWLLGANAARRSEIFRALGAPGIVLVDGEVAGTMRQRRAGRKLRIQVDAWSTLTAGHRVAIEDDADIIGAVRGLDAEVRY